MARELGLGDALAIGIGGMIGGGIFSILGLAAGIAGPAVFLSFVCGGITAIATGYSYTHLSVLYPSAGGSYMYVRKAFGQGRLASMTGWLLWLGYVVACALYAFTFGAYFAAAVIVPFTSSTIIFTISRVFFTLFLIFLFLFINLAGVKETARTQNLIVIAKIVILFFFIAVGSLGLRTYGTKNLMVGGTLFPNGYLAVVIGCALTFIAFEGFELIANASEELRDPERILPRAILYSILIVISIYVITSLVAIINVEYTELKEVEEYALAKAAEPVLGPLGFRLIALGAIFSTASAFNASFYGSSRLSYVLGREGIFPKTFLKINSKRVPARSLEATAILICVLAVFGSLEQIASLASMTFLTIFVLVNLSAFILSQDTRANRAIITLAVCLCVLIMVVLFYYLFMNRKILELISLLLFFLIILVCNEIFLMRTKRASPK